MGAHGDIAALIGTLFDIGAGAEQRAFGRERRENPPTAGSPRVGVMDAVWPEGGLSVSDSPVLLRLMKENAGDFTADDFSARFQSEDKINAIIEELVKDGRGAEAQQVADDFNRALGGGDPLSPSPMDVYRLGSEFEDDVQRTFDDSYARQNDALEIIRGANKEFFPRMRGDLNADINRAQGDLALGEQTAIGALGPGKLASFLPLVTSLNQRREVMGNFKDMSVQAFESQRSGLDARQQQEETDLRTRLAQDPGFSGRPAEIENMVGNLKSRQLVELGDLQTNLVMQQEQIRADLDLQTSSLVTQAAGVSSGQFVSLTQMEAGLNETFSTRRAQLEMNRAEMNLNLTILERQGRVEEAQFLASIMEVIVPKGDAMRELMGTLGPLEDRRDANELIGEGQQIEGLQTIGGGFTNYAAYQMQKDQIEAQQQAQEDANKSSLMSSMIGGGSSIAGAGLGAVGMKAAAAAGALVV